MRKDPAEGLTIGAVAARTGLGVPLLRSWETRFGFPSPRRLPGGHRRYVESDVVAIQRVLAERAAGRSLEAAIEIARRTSAAPSTLDPGTVFAGLRVLHPELPVTVLTRRAMLALSHAIEDECLARAVRPRVAVAFQRAEAWYRSRRRWDVLTDLATSTTVFADFNRTTVRERGVTEVAIGPGTPLGREWSVICESDGFATLLAGWERPDGRFEALWTVDPSAVHTGFGIVDSLVRVHAPELGRSSSRPPPVDPPETAPSSASSAEAIALRAVTRLGA